MKKRIIAALTATVIAMSLAACTQPAAQDEEVSETVFTSVYSDDNLESIDPETTTNEDGSISYKIRTKRYSHWVMKEDGSYDRISDTKIKTDDTWYPMDKEFSSRDTAFIVMDPWIDWSDDYLNEYFGAITQKTTLPLMQAAAESGHTVIILTNDPAKINYNTKIDPGLQALVDEGKAMLLYHSDYNVDSFKALLEEKGIKKLMYTGYASNMCVLYRELGIARMALAGGVELFFIPECSGAMEHADTWETQEIHEATSLVIGQTQALIVNFDDIMNAIKK